jgi:hypothetical protein
MYCGVQRTQEQTVLFSYLLRGFVENNKDIRTYVFQPKFEWAMYRNVRTAELSVLCAKNANSEELYAYT